jgi:hypothetical protein
MIGTRTARMTINKFGNVLIEKAEWVPKMMIECHQ